MGLLAGSSYNQIGGTGAGEGNIISGGSDGITNQGSNDNNIIQGNWIGVGSDGLCVGNGTGQGMSVVGSGNTIGGNSAAARNVISCHDTPGLGSGIDMLGSGNTIQGNYIGTDTDGNVSPGYGNSTAMPVILTASNNLTGGSGAGEGNIIAGNGAGILVLKFGAFAPATNIIIGNSIYDNDGVANGVIVDPSGLAVSTLAETGDNLAWLELLAVALTAFSGVVLWQFYRVKSIRALHGKR